MEKDNGGSGGVGAETEEHKQGVNEVIINQANEDREVEVFLHYWLHLPRFSIYHSQLDETQGKQEICGLDENKLFQIGKNKVFIVNNLFLLL